MDTQEILPGLATPQRDFHVFGYGSLIWNPGFTFVDKSKATIHGFHRKFCLQSTRYRGTADYPGLVLGLDRGGSCTGMAFRVAASDAQAVFAYLFEREMVRYSYHPRWLAASLATADGIKKAPVLCFVVDRSSGSYKGGLTHGQTVETIATAVGPKGPNRDYLRETVKALRNMGVRDRKLESLQKAVIRTRDT